MDSWESGQHEVGLAETVADNLSRVNERIAAAARRAGRLPGEIRLVAVTKKQPLETVRVGLALGIREIAENYVQEAEERFDNLGLRPGDVVRLHFIGHLQSNKAVRAVRLFDMVQSVDSLRIARMLGEQGVRLGRDLEALIEVNAAGEASKSGVPPDEAPDLAAAVAEVPGLLLRGLMAMGPLGGDERSTRAAFRRTRRLFDDLAPGQRKVLSLGMSGDFEAAIEEGATMVRIGTAIFGPRASADRRVNG